MKCQACGYQYDEQDKQNNKTSPFIKLSSMSSSEKGEYKGDVTLYACPVCNTVRIEKGDSVTY